MHVEHVMTKNPIACDVEAPVADAARLMREKGVGSVVVLENGRVAGIVTDRQVAVDCVGAGHDPKDVTVREVMTENPATLSLDDNIFSAVDTMRSANVARRIPVVDNDRRLLGVVSVADLAIIAKDLIDHVLLEVSHSAMEETRILTGAKRFTNEMRRPTKLDKLPREQATKPVTEPTPLGDGATRETPARPSR